MKNLLLLSTPFANILSFEQEKYNHLATLFNFNPLEAVRPLVIRFDIPPFLNRPPESDKDLFRMKWLIGINKAL